MNRLGAITAALLSLLVGACATETAPKPEAAVSDALRLSAIKARAEGNHALAVAQLGKLYVRVPDDRDVVVAYLDSLRRIGASEDALRVADKEVGNYGEDAEFLTVMAKVQIATGRFSEAVETLQKARPLAPRNWQIFSLMGIANDSSGNFDQAQAAYRAALELSPGNSVIINNMALSMAQAGDLDQAIKLLRSVLSTAGRGTPKIRQNLAMLYGFKGNMADFEALARMDLSEDMVLKNLSNFEAFHRRKHAK